MHSFFILIKYVKNYKKYITLASIYSFLNTFFDAFPEIILGFAVDTVVQKKDSFLARLGIVNLEHQLLLLAGILVLVCMLESLFECLYTLQWRKFAQHMQHKLRLNAYDTVQHLDVEFFEQKQTGTLMATLVDDINLLEDFFGENLNKFLQLMFRYFIIGGIFVYVAPRIAFLCMIPIPLILLTAFYFQNKFNRAYAAVRQASGRLSGFIANNLLGILTIKNYTTEQYELDRLAQKSQAYRNAGDHVINLSALFIPIVRMAIALGYVLSLTLGGLAVLRGHLAIGAYSTIVFLTARLLWPFTELAYIIDSYHRAMASAQRVLYLMYTPLVTRRGTKTLDTAQVQGDIVFEHVSFAYTGQNNVVLDNLSFHVQAGQTVAFVGSTGSGKTTVMKLLLRYYDVSKGTILLDGHDLQEYAPKALRHVFGVVSQEPFLIGGTVKENIAYGSFHVSDQEIVQAAKIAQAYDFIMDLPAQFETKIGEQGQSLSGGQKQRISIARAIVKNPAIFIFDEATSAVDNETERAIQESLQTISQDHTTLVIAHRLSTVKNADKIYVLEEGKIVQVGTHEELVAEQGVYAALWNVQAHS